MTDQRRKELATIHVAKKQLGLPDDVYRDVLWTIGRVRSAADLDAHGRARVIEHFKSKGWKPKRKKHRPKPAADRRALADKVIAMMLDMKLSDEYIDGMSARMFHVARWQWLNADQLQRLVAALTYHQKRKARRENQDGA